MVFDGDTFDTTVCHMAFFRDPDGNALMLHRRYAPPVMTTLTREQAAKRFAELPLPSTKDEHWRFTDLRGFDPPNGHDRGQTPDVSAPRHARPRRGRARGRHRERDRDPRRARGRPLRAAPARPRGDADPRRRPVRGREPRALGARPARARREGRRARAAALRPGDLERRHALLADGRDRRGRRPLLPDRGPVLGRARHGRLHERRRRAVRRPGREDRVRLAPEPLARDLALRPLQGVARARLASSTG